MELPDLVTPEDVAGLPGAPFSEAMLRSIGSHIRRVCGWHIAPEVTETLILDHNGTDLVRLPSLYVVRVNSLRDLLKNEEIIGWRESSAGMVKLKRPGPDGFRVLEVDLTHGFLQVPPELARLTRHYVDRPVQQESIAGRSVMYASAGMMAPNSLDDYVAGLYGLGPRP